MVEFLATPTASIVLSLAGLASLIAIGVYLIGKVRGELTAQTDGANEHLSNFRQMHFQGGLSDEEYRTIKAVLAEPLKQEVEAAAQAKVDAAETPVEGQAAAAEKAALEKLTAAGGTTENSTIPTAIVETATAERATVERATVEPVASETVSQAKPESAERAGNGPPPPSGQTE
ncbi:MAG TPA: hypothetical protein VMF30_15915 [Pirellulales bacterium]|nr:hypothetical protein [Pirellulales bacterium]